MDLHIIPADTKIAQTHPSGIYHIVYSEHNLQRIIGFCGRITSKYISSFSHVFGNSTSNSNPRLCGSCFFRFRKALNKNKTIGEKLNEENSITFNNGSKLTGVSDGSEGRLRSLDPTDDNIVYYGV